MATASASTSNLSPAQKRLAYLTGLADECTSLSAALIAANGATPANTELANAGANFAYALKDWDGSMTALTIGPALAGLAIACGGAFTQFPANMDPALVRRAQVFADQFESFGELLESGAAPGEGTTSSGGPGANVAAVPGGPSSAVAKKKNKKKKNNKKKKPAGAAAASGNADIADVDEVD